VAADLPVGDSLRTGASFASLSRRGFGNNLSFGGRDNYNKDILAGRVSFEWTPSASVQLRLSGDYSDDRSDPKGGHRLTIGNASGAPILADVFDTRAGLDGDNRVETHGSALAIDWDLGPQFTLKSISAWRGDDTVTQIDFDSLAVPDFDVPFIVENEQRSQELQLHYGGDRLKGVLGAFYMRADAFNKFDVILGQSTFGGAFPDGVTTFTLGDFATDTWSLFGDFSYGLADALELSVGGRYTSDERSARILRQLYSGQGSPAMGLGGDATLVRTDTDFSGDETFSKFTPRAGLSWQPDGDRNLYMTWSQGFKGGSFDPRGVATQTPDFNGDGQITPDEVKAFLLFEPETVNTWEFGAKTRHLDGRLSSNLALFWSDYEDIQVPGSVGVDTDGDGIEDSFRGVTTNAGKARIRGIEWEALLSFTERLSSALAVGWIDAEFREFIVNNANVADQRVFQKTPEWSGNLSLTYRLPLALYRSDGELAFTGSLSYRDDVKQFDTPIPLLDQEAYSAVNASLVWESAQHGISVGMHGRNLGDREYKVAGYNFPNLGTEGTVTAFYGDPRTVTATLGLRF
jgi:iron complex outermembrane recepter protein